MGQIAHADVRRFFPQALLATAAVLLLPTVLTTALLAWSNPDPPAVVTAGLTVVLAIAVTVLGSSLWMRRPESLEVSFGELMLWGWLRRKRAEDKLQEGSRLLGLDKPGRAPRYPRLTPHEQLEVLRDLTVALESKDPYTHGHSRRVERHVYRTALAMGLSVRAIEDLRKAAALHDVGKIRVPERIVRKPGPLTLEERKMIEDHVSLGAWMVSKVGNEDVVAAVRHHHERWDGRGYPDGLAGDEIPLFARIIAVADTYDAMTSTRPYRASLGRDPAVDTLQEEAGMQFDPAVVHAFLSTLSRAAVAPVAGILFFLLGRPRKMLREIAVVWKRAGASSLAPAAGAASAAVVLGASVLSPPVLAPDPPERQVARASVQQNDGSSSSGLGKVTAPKKRAQKSSDRTSSGDVGVKGQAVTLATNTSKGGDGGDQVLGDRIERDTATATPKKDDPQPQTSTVEAKPKPKQEPATPRAKPDPQPDKGNDCEDNEGDNDDANEDDKDETKGKGATYHCG